jgi:hypothetical protein
MNNTKDKISKKDRISKAWLDGYNSTEIARMAEVSQRYVFYIVRERNLSKLSPHKPGRPRNSK